MIVLMEKEYQGCKVGTVVRFESKYEGMALVEKEYAIEVRWDEASNTYVPVKRVSITVQDGASGSDGA